MLEGEQNLGKIEIIDQSAPLPKPEARGSGLPPTIRTAIGAGGSGEGNGDIPPSFENAFANYEPDPEDGWRERYERQVDAAIALAIDARVQEELTGRVEPIILNGAAETFAKYIDPYEKQPISEVGLRKFMREARKRGLVKHPERSSIRQCLRSISALILSK